VTRSVARLDRSALQPLGKVNATILQRLSQKILFESRSRNGSAFRIKVQLAQVYQDRSIFAYKRWSTRYL
jgi:hypothetical protein